MESSSAVNHTRSTAARNQRNQQDLSSVSGWILVVLVGDKQRLTFGRSEGVQGVGRGGVRVKE